MMPNLLENEESLHTVAHCDYSQGLLFDYEGEETKLKLSAELREVIVRAVEDENLRRLIAASVAQMAENKLALTQGRISNCLDRLVDVVIQAKNRLANEPKK